jgi:hypothetical protein
MKAVEWPNTNICSSGPIRKLVNMKRITRQQAGSGQSIRTGKPWTGADRMRLEILAAIHIPAEKIAKKLRRTEAAVRNEARKQRVMLAPSEKQLSLTQKRPYGGIRVEPRRGPSRATAPGRPARSRPVRQRPEQSETLF